MRALTVIRVECYAGHKADERPLRFFIRDREFRVEEIADRWYSPEANYFRVLADDGNFYVLCNQARQDVWTLEAFRSASRASSGQNS